MPSERGGMGRPWCLEWYNGGGTKWYKVVYQRSKVVPELLLCILLLTSPGKWLYFAFTWPFLTRVNFQIVAVFGWLVATAVNMAVLYGLYGYYQPPFPPMNPNVGALYTACHRFAWSLGLAWLVFACYTGYGGKHLYSSYIREGGNSTVVSVSVYQAGGPGSLRLDTLVSEMWNSITVLLTRSHQCWRLVKKRPSMCCYVCVIMHVKDP